ncbi:hypothetical protein [Thermococcus sp. Bubb.Bath]|uniref:hypothetical protein n=1 Tax=Thermococcus sp. Bubb.Bath TaxID=1638242 RepID=UPI0014392578|nr:hypothetical protein [Thermococcus sp. Bubb.Bath]
MAIMDEVAVLRSDLEELVLMEKIPLSELESVKTNPGTGPTFTVPSPRFSALPPGRKPDLK